ncbi:pyridoxal phosphate-dependent aminotransferase [Paenarthrobacter sp. AB444]|uniref:pyridoxal phosphate-dependent aminotransferase n=1 Tax=Paenarthrobacter sp. AB444 TaxID=3025681 RepID=UPI0023654988|nr:pyridoxal phosphate-dependent aminotransferase [Paenarthrobacter sp. AB444]MDD7833885.1 pyridoxal phosphate-dependent aminotransferase [Paenarthrobacter sp. AB444]
MFDQAIVHELDLRAREGVRNLRSSKIRDVANAGMGKPGVLPFWFGEPDVATPQAIRDVAIAELHAGNVFYTQGLGVPTLREALAGYARRLHGRGDAEQIAVTSSGTSALMTAMQALVTVGDRVVAVTPLWPNVVEMPKVYGAYVESVSLDFSASGWYLDVDKLLAALTPDTKVLVINSPNNPTSWVISREDQQKILEHCRKLGIWIISDEVYERYYFDGPAAPSFLDISHESDRVITTNSFSKTWLMTGWRIGWLLAPRQMMPEISKLIEFSTTCVPGFVQAAALFALENGEPMIADTVARLKASRDHLAAALGSVPQVQLAAPARGAMYSFFRVEGVRDSLQFCKDLISSVGLGLAPGIAFGQEGEGYLRWCFASDSSRIDDGVSRLIRHFELSKPSNNH